MDAAKFKKFSPFLVLIIAILAVFIYQQFMRNDFNFKTTTGDSAIKHSIPLEEIYDGGPGKDGIPSIDDPKFISVSEAKQEFQPDGLGLAVSLNGEDRFYPYQILVWHELVNDKIGETPILVSFCPLCGSGLVFERKINGEEVEFGVSGKLHNSDLLMYDRKTDTLWAQILGEAVVGELTGTQLKQLEANVIPFKVFAEKFSNGKVLSKETGFARNYNTGPYGNYDQSSDLFFPVSKQDNRLPVKTRVLGIEVEGKFKAYVIEKLALNQKIVDQFNGHVLDLAYNDGVVVIRDNTTNQTIFPVNTFWFAWFAFHPDTELYQ